MVILNILAFGNLCNECSNIFALIFFAHAEAFVYAALGLGTESDTPFWKIRNSPKLDYLMGMLMSIVEKSKMALNTGEKERAPGESGSLTELPVRTGV